MFSSNRTKCWGLEHQRHLGKGSGPILAPVQLMHAGTVGFVSPRMEFCGTTCVLKIFGDSEFLADWQTTQEAGSLGKEGLIRNCNMTHLKNEPFAEVRLH